jgi:hypothetical protein
VARLTYILQAMNSLRCSRFMLSSLIRVLLAVPVAHALVLPVGLLPAVSVCDCTG